MKEGWETGSDGRKGAGVKVRGNGRREQAGGR